MSGGYKRNLLGVCSCQSLSVFVRKQHGTRLNFASAQWTSWLPLLLLVGVSDAGPGWSHKRPRVLDVCASDKRWMRLNVGVFIRLAVLFDYFQRKRVYRRVALIHPLSQPLSLKLVFPPNPSPFVCVSPPTPVDKHGPWPRETQGGDKQSSGFYTVRSF